jgi:sphingolipid delta-4 desaturase
MGKTGGDFMLKSRADVPHKERVIRILHEHAEIRRLIGNNPYTFLFICGIVAFQIVVAALVQNAPWWALFLTAYCIGAFANHCLYVLIHECGHNLVFKK